MSMMAQTMILHLMLIIMIGRLSSDFGGPSHFANGAGAQIWSTNQETLPEEATMYSTRLPLKVHYLGDRGTFMRWKAPAHCSAANSSNVETEISCSTAGLHRVRLQYVHERQIINDSRLMIMKNTPQCYRWYVLVERGIENGDEIVVNVWIWDPLLSGPEEFKQTATKPSKISESLTKIFAGKGQVPAMSELLPDPRFQLDCSNMTFLPSHSMWKFYVRVSRCKAHTVRVSGKPSVASHGCFIRDTKAVISSMCVDEIVQSEGSLALNGQPGVSMVIKDPCKQDTAFLIMSGQCLFTMNGFKSTDHISVSADVIMGASVNVKDIAITTYIVIYLLEGGSLLAQNRSSGTFMWLTDVSNLNAIEGRQACHDSQMRKLENEMFLGWKDGSIHIWHGTELIDSIQVNKEQVSSLPYPFWLEEDIMEAFVGHVAFTDEHNELSVLMKVTSDKQSVSIIFKKEWTSDSWGKPQPFFSKKGVNTTFSLLQLHDADGSIIMWDQNSVYYSYAKGRDHGTMGIHNALDDEGDDEGHDEEEEGHDEEEEEVEEGHAEEVEEVEEGHDEDDEEDEEGHDEDDEEDEEGHDEDDEGEIKPSVKQITVTVDGCIIVLSSNNVLYTSLYYQKALIRHSALAAPDSDLAVYTNFVDQVYILQINGSLVERTSYSLKADMGSIVNQLDYTECMYFQFKEGPQYEVYYLDLRDSAIIWAELVYSADRYNDIETVINQPDKLSIEEQVITDFNPGSKSIKKVLRVQSSFLFEENERYEEALASATGLVTIAMRPRRLGIGCHSPSKMVSEFEMGCPPQRHIIVHKPAECNHLGSYTINKKSYVQQNGEPPETEMVVEYDKQMYGCPITQSVKDVFKPEIDLYDEDVLVETMTANFVMWEENGRHDFTYTASMHSAGCLRVAQTWEKMKEDVDNDVPVKRIWGPHNYESCFTYQVTERRLLHNSYQILNHSGDNSIRWLATGVDQLYVFTLHVVDPYYSYCSLDARVAVIVSDERLVEVRETPLLRMSLGTFAGLTGSILIVSYFYYRRDHINDLALELHQNYGENAEKDNEQEDNVDD